MASSSSPTRVSQVRDRYPLRWVTRSGVRAPSSAPIWAATSASISSAAIQVALSRSTSGCSSASSLFASWAAVILGLSAIVVILSSLCGNRPTILRRRGGRTHNQQFNQPALLHHSPRRDLLPSQHQLRLHRLHQPE